MFEACGAPWPLPWCFARAGAGLAAQEIKQLQQRLQQLEKRWSRPNPRDSGRSAGFQPPADRERAQSRPYR